MNHYLNSKVIYEGIEITDIWKKFDFIEKYKNEELEYYDEYIIKDGETPEIVSDNFYGSEEWWWVVLIYNKKYDPFFDWPLSQLDLESYAKKLIPDWQYHINDYINKLNELSIINDENKKIKVLKKEYLNNIVLELKNFYK